MIESFRRLTLPAGELALVCSPAALPGALVLGTGSRAVLFRLTRPGEPPVSIQIVADELYELVDLAGAGDAEVQPAIVAWLIQTLPAGDIRAAFAAALRAPAAQGGAG